MKVVIAETNEETTIDYAGAEDVMGNWGYRFDKTISQADYEWWTDIFARLEAIDATGIDWSEYEDELTDSDLEMRVSDMERIAGIR